MCSYGVVTTCNGCVLCLDLSLGAGFTADRADHVAVVHLDHVIIETEYTLVPGASVDVVINAGLHALEVHNLIPDGE